MLLIAVCSVAAACGDSTQLVDTATADSALQTTQCNYGGASACFDTFNSCIAAANADLTACNDALHACLPPPPARPDGGMPGGCRGGHGGFDSDGDGRGGFGGPGGAPPPLPDGGLPPPPPGDHHGGPPPIDSAAASACHDALNTCLAGDPTDPRTCFDAERQCVQDALRADFQAQCTAALAACTGVTSDACTRITQRCNDGVGAMPASCP
jgi:hypothetical protein